MAGDGTNDFGALLRRFRLTAGLSQQALAERAGLSVDAVAALERGRRRNPRAFTVRVLADTLGLGERHREELVHAASGSVPVARTDQIRPPAPRGPLVGREADVVVVTELLRSGDARLVTLSGPGGVGKTQLALTVAGRLGERYTDGVAFAPLAFLSDAAALPEAVANAFGVRQVGGQSVEESIAGELGERRPLLVLDNCEHMVAACARLVDRLLGVLPGLSVLATSRERLRLPGEVVHSVAPLPVPAVDGTADGLLSAPAVELFVRRVRALNPTLELSPDNMAAIARVCRELDGLPLALELAAARANVLTVRQIADDLDALVNVLTMRTSESRQRTLRATMRWSYDLLTPGERRALRRLSVFAGTWSLEAAEAVCTPGEGEAAALALVSSLVDKSLVRPSAFGERNRYFLLSTIRMYAYELLHESGDLPEAAAQHAAYMAGLAERAETGLQGPEQAGWLSRMDAEMSNVRVALRRSELVDPRVRLRLAGALWRYCYLRGRYREGRGWLADVLTATVPDCQPAERAEALLGAGVLAFLECDYASAGENLESALALFRRIADHRGVADALQRLGSIARERGEYAKADRLHRESLAIAARDGDRAHVHESLNYLGFLAWLTGDLEGANRLCGEALRVFRDHGASEGTAWALISLGAAGLYAGTLDTAEELLRESLSLSYDLGFREGVAWALDLLGVLARRRGRQQEAWELLAESLDGHYRLGDRWRAASVCEELAGVAVDRDPQLAARLLGVADELRTVTGARRPPVEQADHDAGVAACRRAIGDAYEDAVAMGRLTPVGRIVEKVREAHPVVV
ncbi:MAG TPA: tetratricopeptide repeat protein [Streptosporangiales bacterium]